MSYPQRIEFEDGEASNSSASTLQTLCAIAVISCLKIMTREETNAIEVFVEYVDG